MAYRIAIVQNVVDGSLQGVKDYTVYRKTKTEKATLTKVSDAKLWVYRHKCDQDRQAAEDNAMYFWPGLLQKPGHFYRMSRKYQNLHK
jgi:hypothetical protein